jgi:hypothetical protein
MIRLVVVRVWLDLAHASQSRINRHSSDPAMACKIAAFETFDNGKSRIAFARQQD